MITQTADDFEDFGRAVWAHIEEYGHDVFLKRPDQIMVLARESGIVEKLPTKHLGPRRAYPFPEMKVE